MISKDNAMGYEFSSILFVVVLLFFVQLITGPIFWWIIWFYSGATVTLGFLDHVCVEWKLSLEIQMRRILMDILIGVPAGFILYYSMYYLMPDVNFQSVMSIITGVQRLIRLSSVWGPLLYTYVYFLLHVIVLSFIRIFMNFGFIIFMGINEMYPMIETN